jgi:hypothetical protein
MPLKNKFKTFTKENYGRIGEKLNLGCRNEFSRVYYPQHTIGNHFIFHGTDCGGTDRFWNCCRMHIQGIVLTGRHSQKVISKLTGD